MLHKFLFITILITALSARVLLSPPPVNAQNSFSSTDEITSPFNSADSLLRRAVYDSALFQIRTAQRLISEEPHENDTLKARLYLLKGKWAFEKGDYKSCESCYDSCRTIIDRPLNQKSSKQAEIMIHIGGLYYKQARYDESENIILEALNILKKNPELNRDLRAIAINNLVPDYIVKTDFSKAASLIADNLELLDSLNKGNSREKAVCLYNKAVLHHKMSEFTKAETSYRKALDIAKELYGEEHPLCAEIISGLGTFNYEIGHFTEAETMLARSTALLEQMLGNNHYLLAVNLNRQASLYFKIGMYSKMDSISRQAMAIVENTFGYNHPEMAASLNVQGALDYVQSKLAAADEKFERSLAINEKIFGPYHPEVAYQLDNLGTLNTAMGNYEKAEIYAKKGLKTREQILGPNHTHVAKSLIGVAFALARQKKYAEAVPYVERAMTVRTNAFGHDHPDVAQCYDYLGVLAFILGDIDKAVINKLEAFSVYEKTLGPWHSNVSRNALALGVIYARRGDYEQSRAYFQRFRELRSQLCEYAFSYSSEEQKLKWIDQFPLLDNNILSLALKDNSPLSGKLAFEMILTGKAAVIDALMVEKEKALCTEDERVRKCLDQRNVICTAIANLVIAGQTGQTITQNPDSLQTLLAVKDSLEEHLSRLCSDFKRELSYRFRIDSDRLTEVLPDSTALWEFIRYTPSDFSELNPVPLHTDSSYYLAFVLNSTGSLTAVDLGRANRIDSLIENARALIGHPSVNLYSPQGAVEEKRLAATTANLYETVFSPLVSVSPNTKHIFIAPDARLYLLPFEILPLPDGRYAVEQYRISYLTSGRDLLDCDNAPVRFNNVVLIGDPDFDFETGHDQPDDSPSDKETAYPVNTTDRLQRSGNCLDSPFPPLRYSRQEMNAIVELFGEHRITSVKSYYGGEAREQILKNSVFPPDILHLSTHGYFCGDERAVKNPATNALLRSGLALAGANLKILNDENKDNIDDGILTAFEISGLNLVGTQLAVLSACETGLGETSDGEGVFGLQRAFRHAGAGSLILSLWKVPDKETGELMVKFYDYWLRGESRIDALRRASLDMLQSCRETYGHSHPALWSGFILVGNPN